MRSYEIVRNGSSKMQHPHLRNRSDRNGAGIRGSAVAGRFDHVITFEELFDEPGGRPHANRKIQVANGIRFRRSKVDQPKADVRSG